MTFTYKPLDHSRASVRLLEVLPRQHEDDEIQCNIRHVLLDDKPEYTALSYEWGDAAESRRTIRLNGTAFKVRANLFSFLEHALRSTLIGRLTSLWVDAVCINQDDVQEKNYQVQQMKSIYQNARKVLAWIGPSTGEIDRLFESLAERDRFAALEDKLRWATTADELPRYLRVAVGDIASRSYFSRLWVVQELVLCDTVDIVCGTLSIPFYLWSTVRQLMADFPTQPGPLTVNTSCCDRLLQMRKLRRSTASHDESVTSLTILKLVKSFSVFRASRPCDTVYALLGLAVDSDKVHIEYGTSIEIVLIDLLLTCPKLTRVELESYLAIFRTDYSAMLRTFNSRLRVSHELNVQSHSVRATITDTDGPPASQSRNLEGATNWIQTLFRAFHEPLVRLDLEHWAGDAKLERRRTQPRNGPRGDEQLRLCACRQCGPTLVNLAARLRGHWESMQAFQFDIDNQIAGSRYTGFMLFDQHQYIATAVDDRVTPRVVIMHDPALGTSQVDQVYLKGMSGFQVTTSLWHLLHVWCLANHAKASGLNAASVPLRCKEGTPLTLRDLSKSRRRWLDAQRQESRDPIPARCISSCELHFTPRQTQWDIDFSMMSTIQSEHV